MATTLEKIAALKRTNAKLDVVQHIAGKLIERACTPEQALAQVATLRDLITAANDALIATTAFLPEAEGAAPAVTPSTGAPTDPLLRKVEKHLSRCVPLWQ